MDAEAAAELAALVAPADRTLADAFAASELAPRVAALCSLRSWTQQAGGSASVSAAAADDDAASAAAAARAAGLSMWDQLLHLATADPALAGAVRPMSPLHRKKVSAPACNAMLSLLAGILRATQHK